MTWDLFFPHDSYILYPQCSKSLSISSNIFGFYFHSIHFSSLVCPIYLETNSSLNLMIEKTTFYRCYSETTIYGCFYVNCLSSHIVFSNVCGSEFYAINRGFGQLQTSENSSIHCQEMSLICPLSEGSNISNSFVVVKGKNTHQRSNYSDYRTYGRGIGFFQSINDGSSMSYISFVNNYVNTRQLFMFNECPISVNHFLLVNNSQGEPNYGLIYITMSSNITYYQSIIDQNCQNGLGFSLYKISGSLSLTECYVQEHHGIYGSHDIISSQTNPASLYDHIGIINVSCEFATYYTSLINVSSLQLSLIYHILYLCFTLIFSSVY